MAEETARYDVEPISKKEIIQALEEGLRENEGEDNPIHLAIDDPAALSRDFDDNLRPVILNFIRGYAGASLMERTCFVDTYRRKDYGDFR